MHLYYLKSIGFYVLLFLISSLNYISASIINVPDDKSDINLAIEDANFGDTILIAPGIYFEQIAINQKNVVLASKFLLTNDSSYISTTIIDGSGSTILIIKDVSNPFTVVNGLTFRNGDDGIWSNSKFTISNCIILNCKDGIDYEAGSGGLCFNNVFQYNLDDGIDLDENVEISIINNTIAFNNDDGIEIRLHPYSGEMLVYIIEGNQIFNNGEDGIQLIDYQDSFDRIFYINRNFIYNNRMVGLGLMGESNTIENYEGAPISEQIIVSNNVFDNNNYALTGGINVIAVNNIFINSQSLIAKNLNGNSMISYSLLFNNSNEFDNCNLDRGSLIFEDPMLVEGYNLSSTSPAIDAGISLIRNQSDTLFYIPSDDFKGEAPDIGAKESPVITSTFNSMVYPEIKVYPNPVTCSTIYLSDSPFPLFIEVFDPKGRLILSRHMGINNRKMDLPIDCKGILLIRIMSKQGIRMHRLFVR